MHMAFLQHLLEATIWNVSIYMLLGPTRMTYTARERAEAQGIDHLIRPRFTRVADTLGPDAGIQEYYSLLQNSTVRNTQIITDVQKCLSLHRTIVVLTRIKTGNYERI